MGRFYVTTPIYYVNALLHLGHAYATIAADVLARWNRLLLGRDSVRFTTGLDEHGGNIEKLAAEKGITPQQWVDEIAVQDERFFRDLKMSHGDFIRTTEERHRVACMDFWGRVRKDDIVPGKYEGLYCRSCEAYYQENEAPGGKCPIHRTEVEHVGEDTFFFKLSNYTEFLRAYYRDHPGFVMPDVRRREMESLIGQGLRDVSITRTRIGWGFRVPGHENHVIYVWFDALINYLTSLGYPDPKFEEFWGRRDAPRDGSQTVVHVIGKEINRFHSLLWPAMLESARLRLPDRIAVHGFWTVEGEKISKTRGNVIDPRELVADYQRKGVKHALDALRYFLLREIPFGHDGGFSKKRFEERYDADLANDLGNLAHRAISMVFRYSGGKVPCPRGGGGPWESFVRQAPGLMEHADAISALASQGVLSFTQAAFERIARVRLSEPQFQDALVNMWEIVKHGHKYLDDRAPWKKDQDPSARAETLGQVLVLLEAASWPLLAFMPDAMAELRRMLGFSDIERREALPEVFSLTRGDPLFPRIDTKGRKGAGKP